MTYVKVDQRELGLRNWQAGDSPNDRAMAAELQLAAEPTPEGNKAWADIIFTATTPIRTAMLTEDTISDIFLVERVGKNQLIDYQINFFQNSNRHEFIAYTLPDTGRLPQRYASAGNVIVDSYRIGNAIDFHLRYLETARWNILAQGIEAYRDGFVQKVNSDGWGLLMGAMRNSGIVINDELAPQGYITPRLLTLMQVYMRRISGGSNMNRSGFAMTDLYVSPEAAAAMRSWDATMVPQRVLEQIYSTGADTPLSGLFDLTIHQLDDLGVGQPLQELFLTPRDEGGLGGSLPPGTTELIIGMDRRNTGVYAKMPIRDPGLVTFPDNDSSTIRHQTRGIFGWQNSGMAVLDPNFCTLGAF